MKLAMWQRISRIVLLIAIAAFELNTIGVSATSQLNRMLESNNNDNNEPNKEIDHQPVIVVSYSDGNAIESLENTQNEDYKIFQVLPERSITVCCMINDDSSSQIVVHWLKNDSEIAFDTESGYKRLNDTCFSILATDFITHSDEYSCETEPITEKLSFVLYVKSIPNAPKTVFAICEERKSIVRWNYQPVEDVQIGRFIFSFEFNYTVEYRIHEKSVDNEENPEVDQKVSNVDDDANDWSVYETGIDNAQFSPERPPFCNVSMQPWSTYSFRVIAYNDMGASMPNEFHENCKSASDVPYNNPVDVMVNGTTPTNLVVSWQPMPPSEQNGPDFYYRIYWKRNIPDAEWNTTNVTDWKQDHFIVEDQPTFVSYLVKVEAANEIGPSNQLAPEIVGYSGEGEPTEAPTKLSVTQLGNTTVILQWNPVSFNSIRGKSKGYKIYTWDDVDGEMNKQKISIPDWNATATKLELRIDSMNYLCIFIRNTLYDGPISEIIEIKMPHRVSCPIESFNVFQLGSTAFLLRWKKNNASGYKISHEEIDGPFLSFKNLPPIYNRDADQAKVAGLKPETNYRLHLICTTNIGDGERYSIDARTKSNETTKPNQPSFMWEILESTENTDDVRIKVIWMPNVDGGNAGSNFFVKYRRKGIEKWNKTDEIKTEDYAIIPELPVNEIYAFRVVSVDGQYKTESQTVEISTRTYEPPTSPTNIYIVPVMMIIVAMVIVSALYTLRKQRLAKNKIETNQKNVLTTGAGPVQDNYLNFETGDPDSINPKLSLDEQADLLPYDRKYEFPRGKLKFGRQLGSGSFGARIEAIAQGIQPGEEETTVAVKTIQRLTDFDTLRALAMELKVLIHAGKHLNVINLLGAVTTNISKNELMMIVEYSPYGNLRNFLIKYRANFINKIIDDAFVLEPHSIDDSIQSVPLDRPITTTDLLFWSYQTANGMQFLASRKVLHGDLAIRNIMLCDGNVVKIRDFGLAGTMYKTGFFHAKTQRSLPYKWLALESISDQVFTTYSDVWSFGVVLWELFSLGASPYSDTTVGVHLYNKLKEGFRLEMPEFATEELYDLMQSCWRVKPETRPLFDELTEKFAKILGPKVTNHYSKLNEAILKVNKHHIQFDYVTLLNKTGHESPSYPENPNFFPFPK